MSEEQPQEEPRADQHPVPLTQTFGYGAGTFLTVGVIDLLAHWGPTGLVIGGIAAYVVARHGPELTSQVREALPSPPAGQPEIEEPRQHGKRSFMDRALGRHPEGKPAAAEATADDTVVVPEEDSQEHAHNAADAPAMVVYAARDPRLALSLAPQFRPDVDLVLREGIFACGCKGSGKTGVLAQNHRTDHAHRRAD